MKRSNERFLLTLISQKQKRKLFLKTEEADHGEKNNFLLGHLR